MSKNMKNRHKHMKKSIKKPMKKPLKIILGIIMTIIILLFITFMIIFHSPYTKLKELWVTTAMKTMNHQYLAYWFVSEVEIAEIMNNNKVLEPTEVINVENIIIGTNNESSSVDNPSIINKNTIERIDIAEDGFKGNLLIVHDPSRIFVGVSDKLGAYGQKLLDMTNSYNAVGGINAGGFEDTDGVGNGGQAYGLTISQGKVLGKTINGKTDLVGFTKDNKLVIGSYTLNEINTMKIRDAVSFSPPLVINGIPTKIIGDGGWGIQPRTAIGQRKDGTVLILVIDGRQISSIGVTIKKLQEIMIRYNVENATNLDGGSSTTMVYNEEIINSPCSSAGPRYLPNAFLISQPIKDGVNDTTLLEKQIG